MQVTFDNMPINQKPHYYYIRLGAFDVTDPVSNNCFFMQVM